MDGLDNNVERIERVLNEFWKGNRKASDAYREIRDGLLHLVHVTPDTSTSLAQTFEVVADQCPEETKRTLGTVTLRLLGTEGALPEEAMNNSARHIVRIVEEGCADLVTIVVRDPKALTHEKLAAFKTIHLKACDDLAHLRQSFSNIQDLSARRQVIMRALNQGLTKSYLHTFGFASMSSSVSSLLKLVDNVSQAQGSELQSATQALLESVTDDLDQYTDHPTFIGNEYVAPFLRNIQSTAAEFQASLGDRFHCRIVVPPSLHRLEKRYPLHLVGSQNQIFVPLSNDGPGTAQEVVGFCIADSCEIQTEETRLGNIAPGQFTLPINFSVTEPTKRIEIYVEVHWAIVGNPAVHMEEFFVEVEGQRTDLDWTNLSQVQPYSLDVALGTEFYGRKDALRKILRRLEHTAMQSTYITGQKRVGKSSVARAIQAELEDRHAETYRCLYLECGEVIHASGKETLEEIGRHLETFLGNALPRSVEWQSGEYSSSLAPLNRLVRQLFAATPEARFVVILDEFDEINESLYRHGELANTFFLNLRTLSSMRNIAFVLVGAERMPFVMSSQGEKLNKFVRESLDSFSQENEWADYRDLVQMPVKDTIQLHESAFRELFRQTNGHPYFTKLLCAGVYEFAVELKDAEITATEIKKTARRVVETLDINVFAHYWRDGISGDANDIEIISLKRCRLLVAWSRTARSGKPLTCEEIQSNQLSSSLGDQEIRPILDDFCRRGIFSERVRKFHPSVELFAVWLKEVGFPILISDKLGDELMSAQQVTEDAAYVRADEIVKVTSSWNLYQGRQITADDVRSWLQQVESNVEQRALFLLLENLRFYGDAEVRELFDAAHSRVRQKLPPFVRKSRVQRREDIVVSYAGGPGKSGAHYAALYANTAEIISHNIIPPDRVSEFISSLRDSKETCLVIVDDVIGTGHNLVGQLNELSEPFAEAKIGTNVLLVVVVLCATVEGENRVRKYIAERWPNADLEICESMGEDHFAFTDSLGFWDTDGQKSIAKSLVTNLGVRVQRRKPLGYGDQGLLLTFSRNCPNNSLPILHGSGKGHSPWTPLFRRTKS